MESTGANAKSFHQIDVGMTLLRARAPGNEFPSNFLRFKQSINKPSPHPTINTIGTRATRVNRGAKYLSTHLTIGQ